MNALGLRPRWPQSLPPLSRLPSASSSLSAPSSASSRLLELRQQHCRHVATSRRTTKALRVKPAPSATAAIAVAKRLAPTQNSIVFNPPPTAPSPYQTPPLFLPPSDPRRTLLAPVYAHNNPYQRTAASVAAGEAETDADLPPAFRPPSEKKYHLNAEQIEEIRSKRTSNPWVWTRKRLAEEYGCSEYFVSMCAQAVPARRKWHEQNLEAVKARWGPKKQKAREERAKRHKIWQRDE